MFPPQDTPRVFGVPIGTDMTQGLVDGLDQRIGQGDPMAWAQVEVFVNTKRVSRRIRDVIQAGPARLHPKIRLISDIAREANGVSPDPLAQRLEVSQLVRDLVLKFPDIAPLSSVFGLSDSLMSLFEEMHSEGVSAQDLLDLKVEDQSGYWDRSLQFVRIIQKFFADDTHPTTELVQREAVMAQIKRWDENPPQHPVIIAGSTGSRGTTLALMKAVANLPQGAVILPGFDFGCPSDVWDSLTAHTPQEDHPQYRFAKIMNDWDLKPDQIGNWSASTPINIARNQLISLSLRPAPITHYWLSEGPKLENLQTACNDITWVEAADQRAEAEAIALRLRHAVEQGETAAVVTPDRNLTRRIATALQRWNIIPDDSAGVPLSLSPPGRLLLQTLDLFDPKLPIDRIISILKHPLVAAQPNRGDHLRHTRDLELHLRRYGPAFPEYADLIEWARKKDDRLPWVAWLSKCIYGVNKPDAQNIPQWIEAHLARVTLLADGPAEIEGTLWDKEAGRKSEEAITKLRGCGDAAGPVALMDYSAVLRQVLNGEQVHDHSGAHPKVLIWGTLEARVQGADLVILAGLNEGIWPEAPAPDPWLNRTMRKDINLLLPERRVGLSAHDYQQAMGAKQVWVTRSLRSDDAETIPSRWLNRLENLMMGVDEDLLRQMKQNGKRWCAMADQLDLSPAQDPAPRPAPAPPATARPTTLSVTDIKHLIRNPYHIYAKHVLGLRALNPLVQSPDPALRGTVIHSILEHFASLGPKEGRPVTVGELLRVAERTLQKEVPWPADRRLWLARIAAFAEWFVQTEINRQDAMTHSLPERRGTLHLPDLGFSLIGTADRIDILNHGGVHLYDYKTGAAPTKGQQEHFDKQLLLEIEMINRGAFEDIGKQMVLGADYIQLNTSPKIVPAADAGDTFWPEFCELIKTYQLAETGFTARRAMLEHKDISDYDHLSRLGEWDVTEESTKVILT